MGRRSARYEERLFVVEGPVLVKEALAAGWNVLEMYIRSNTDHDIELPVGAETFTLEDSVFDSVSDTVTPQGVLAVVEMADNAQLRQVHDFVVVADAISDPGNLGTIIRSAEASGAQMVCLIGESVDPFSPKVVRASAGAVFHVPLLHIESWDVLKQSGFSMIGSTSHAQVAGIDTKSMYDLDYSGRIAIIMGNEAHGLAESTPVDEWVTIPHVGRAESLNVAMAASVLCMNVAHARTRSNNRRPAGLEG